MQTTVRPVDATRRSTRNTTAAARASRPDCKCSRGAHDNARSTIVEAYLRPYTHGRLVEEEDGRVGAEFDADCEALSLARREAIHCADDSYLAVCEVAQLQKPQQVRNEGGTGTPRDTGLKTQPRSVGKRLAHGCERHVQVRLLAIRSAAIKRCHIKWRAVNVDTASEAPRVFATCQHVQKRSFAGACRRGGANRITDMSNP